MEGIPKEEWCYPEHADIKEGMKPVPGYLSKKGYRLPTEAEWEYACRAGAATSRFYGASVDLLGQYAWYIHNASERAHPVGLLKPNDFGLFDIQGNAFEWTNDRPLVYRPKPGEEAIEDIEDLQIVRDASLRVLRGGAFTRHPSNVRSAHRDWDRPADRGLPVGFRVARTYD